MFSRLQKWFAALLGNSDTSVQLTQSAATKHEQRTHGRYAIPQKSISDVAIGDKLRLPLIDISYGGLSLYVSAENIEEIKTLIHSPLEAKLHFLGNNLEVSLDFVYVDASKCEAGAAFHHKQLDTLIYLRDLLEAFRIGAAMTTEKPDATTYLLKGEDLTIDIQVEEDEKSIANFTAQLPRLKSNPSPNSSAYICEYANGHWKTGSIELRSSGKNSQEKVYDELLSTDTLRFLTIVILGAQAENQTCLKILEHLLLEKLAALNSVAGNSIAS